MSDRTRASSFLAGDRRTLDRVRSVVTGVVRGFRLPSEGWKDDLIQEVMGRVFLSLAHGRFREEASLETYARNVARFTCLEHLRQQQRQTEFDSQEVRLPVAQWAPADELLLRDEEHSENLRAFSLLPAGCRELFHQVFVERLSYREIAYRLGVTEGAVRLRIHRCREKRKQLRREASREVK